MRHIKFYFLSLAVLILVLAIGAFFYREPVIVNYYFDKAPYISPRIIDDLCTGVVTIDLDGSIGTNRYFGDIKVEESRVTIEPVTWYPLPHVWYQYIGKTEDGIYALKRGRDQDRGILLVEFENKGRLLLKKLGEIPLDQNWDGNAQLEGNTLSLGNLGTLQIENPYSRRIRTLFHRFMNQKIYNTALPCFLNRAPYISPKVIEDLTSWISDGGDQVLSIDLTGAESTENKWKYEGEFFAYGYIGQSHEINVLKTQWCGGGSGVFENILLVTFERDYGMSVDWEKREILQNKERIVIKKHGTRGLGDRWIGDLTLQGNQLYIGPDEGNLAPRSVEGELLDKAGHILQIR